MLFERQQLKSSKEERKKKTGCLCRAQIRILHGKTANASGIHSPSDSERRTTRHPLSVCNLPGDFYRSHISQENRSRPRRTGRFFFQWSPRLSSNGTSRKGTTTSRGHDKIALWKAHKKKEPESHAEWTLSERSAVVGIDNGQQRGVVDP